VAGQQLQPRAQGSVKKEQDDANGNRYQDHAKERNIVHQTNPSFEFSVHGI
jgi:hypothetical protein